MRNHPLLHFLLILPLVGCASSGSLTHRPEPVVLGQTKGQITRELGPHTAWYMNGFYLFHDHGNEVQAHFEHGKADAIYYYTFDRKITDPWLTKTLGQHSHGTPWILEASASTGRRVYRSQDGRLHAFLSGGNQLLVDTSDFFGKSLHQPGKSIPVDELPECVFAPDHNLAHLGVTEAFVIRNYGQPIATAPDGAKEYDAGYQSIVVHFKNGHCDAVLYAPDNHRKFNACWISCLQQLNSLDAWVVSESSKPDSVYYWTPKDDKVAHLIKRRSFIVYSVDYGRERNQATKTTDKKKSGFTSFITPCGSVWLGETEATMTKKLGSPLLDKKTRVYRDGNLTIRADFEHGVCNRIIYYSKKERFSDHWVSATLAVNSRGRSWFTFEDSTPKKSFFRTYDRKFFARLKNGTDLGIMTSEFLKKKQRASASSKLENLNN